MVLQAMVLLPAEEEEVHSLNLEWDYLPSKLEDANWLPNRRCMAPNEGNGKPTILVFDNQRTYMPIK